MDGLKMSEGCLVKQTIQVDNGVPIGVLNSFEILFQPEVGEAWREAGEPFYLIDSEAAISIPGNIFISFENFHSLHEFFGSKIRFLVPKICKRQPHPAQSFFGL